MFSTVITTSVIAAVISCWCSVPAAMACQPRPSSAGSRASGRVATTAVTVRIPANR